MFARPGDWDTATPLPSTRSTRNRVQKAVRLRDGKPRAVRHLTGSVRLGILFPFDVLHHEEPAVISEPPRHLVDHLRAHALEVNQAFSLSAASAFLMSMPSIAGTVRFVPRSFCRRRHISL